MLQAMTAGAPGTLVYAGHEPQVGSSEAIIVLVAEQQRIADIFHREGQLPMTVDVRNAVLPL